MYYFLLDRFTYGCSYIIDKVESVLDYFFVCYLCQLLLHFCILFLMMLAFFKEKLCFVEYNFPNSN